MTDAPQQKKVWRVAERDWGNHRLQCVRYVGTYDGCRAWRRKHQAALGTALVVELSAMQPEPHTVDETTEDVLDFVNRNASVYVGPVGDK